MIQGPPSPPLFPYTTLFRSVHATASRTGATPSSDSKRSWMPVMWSTSLSSGPVESRTDRKSTRLNSSHSQISYAVFCLKKKSDHTHVQRPHDDSTDAQRRPA